MFRQHPKGLPVLFAAEMWERFSYYGMRALLVYYLTRHFLMSDGEAYALYGSYTALVYALPVIGGLLADRLLGARKSVTIGALLLSLGHLTMAIEGDPAQRIMLADGTSELVQDQFGLQALYIALALIAVGVGFLKPNISTMVGKLYEPGDTRRDGGFTLFYMGINIGAFAATIVCGYLGETWGWAYGFGLAGIGMLFGLLVFLRGQKHLYGYAEPPDPERLVRPLALGLSAEKFIWLGALAMIVLMWQVLQYDWIVSTLLLVVAAVAISGLVGFSLLRCDARERANMLVMLFLIVASVLFWSLFEQAGTSLSLFAERSLDREVAGITVAPSQFQSLNPLFIILLAPLFAGLWQVLSSRGFEPSLPAKFSLGILQVGLGFLALVIGASYASEAGKVALIWLVLAYFLHTTGELCLSPVGLSMVTKLSVPRVVSLVMGVWFLSSAFAANLGALIAKGTNLNTEGGGTLTGMDALQAYVGVFWALALVAMLCGGLLLVFSPWLAKRIHETEETEETEEDAPPPKLPPKSGGSEVAASQMETEFLWMSLDHDSGDLSGEVKKGTFAGQQLAEMSLESLLVLLSECRRLDTRSADLLEAWLDHVHGNAWRGKDQDRSEQERQEGPPEARLSRRKAAEILGVSEDASKEDVLHVYRRLIQHLHSDRGGSTYLASLINLARDELLKEEPV